MSDPLIISGGAANVLKDVIEQVSDVEWRVGNGNGG